MRNQNAELIKDLADKWLRGMISPEELEILEQWYNQEAPEKVFWEKDDDKQALQEKIYGNISSEIKREARRRYIQRWYPVAAALIIVFSVIGFRYYAGRSDAAATVQAVSNSRFKNDIAPGGTKATLTLGDGTTITLDSNNNGAIAKQGNTSIINFASGELAYNTEAANGNIYYNTITTPRGGKYKLILSDGTSVWLNTASSLRFPTAFKGAERLVELTGEAYFEVKKNQGQTFKVKTARNAEIQVLGTHFDINAYDDEELLKTTLLEGAVSVTNDRGIVRSLRPGQQAQLNASGSINVKSDVNTDEAVAWKNDRFHFESADIKTIMRQAARWYDMEPEYRAEITDRFVAEIPANSNASDFLKALELTGKVKFMIEGKKVIISQ